MLIARPVSNYLDLALTFRLFLLSLLTLFFLHLSLILIDVQCILLISSFTQEALLRLL
ncbi:uncharacterized protein PRCAT00001968001 [Priceomyces carsonii]|uniref:uncharacterized protein n=1 Tax=Priceomyces carsonii TaxID=28549 RepID=UPI002ED7BA94|nr:unnamed protein product [Priceomyces carsonii]